MEIVKGLPVTISTWGIGRPPTEISSTAKAMCVDDAVCGLTPKQASSLCTALIRINGNGCATRRKQPNGTYTVWRIK